MLDDAREETVSQTNNGEPGMKEAEALAAALNHSAERVQTLWFSFLTFMLYLAIATGTTTHRMLFLEEPLNLPVLNIKLPLLGFYVLTPIIFVVLHFYVLLNLVLLARTAKSFEEALQSAFPNDENEKARETFRMRIENTLFVQLLVGGRLEREGINAKLLSLMALITLALAPVALLLMFEVKFLPYHNEPITWWHRILLALDLALVWTLWPGYRSGCGGHLWPKAAWWLVVPGIGSAAALAYAVMVAAFPDEQMYSLTNWLHGSTRLNPILGRLSSPDNWFALIAPVNTLDLHGEDLIDGAKRKQIIEKNESSADAQRWVATLSLSGRDLTGANLSHADIRHGDFTGAILNRANPIFAWAEEAHFDRAQFQGASLLEAHLQGASLVGAQLRGVVLDRAQLRGASLVGAQLRGVVLDRAQLRGASLVGAQLQGASLEKAQLQGASLYGTQLQGASLYGAQLQGAKLDDAQLQGASLDGAQLQGASLIFAQLQGAWLGNARLQGALLNQADLRGASFVGACAWRADARKAAWGDTRVTTPPKADEAHKCEWTAAQFAALKQLIAKEVPDGENKGATMERIDQRLDPTTALEGEDEMAKIWAAGETEAPSREAYVKSLAGQLRDVGCAAKGAPYVLHALIARLGSPGTSPFGDQSDAAKALASAFLDEAHCPGAHGLSEADKATLKEIAAPAAPSAPRP
jgi:uncharacterized protein YjbI with pentapeptide repeats